MTPSPPPLVLASASPRRRELLDGLGIAFEVRPTSLEEVLEEGEGAREAAERLAIEKARAIDVDDRLVLAADTLVVLDDLALGKPFDADEARHMLRQLSGRRHEVMTGVAVRLGEGVASGVETTQVEIAPLSDDDIDWYVATGEPRDKAGAYAIQGLGALFVTAIEGNYANVVGLPIPLLGQLLRTFGWTLRDLRRDERVAADLSRRIGSLSPARRAKNWP